MLFNIRHSVTVLLSSMCMTWSTLTAAVDTRMFDLPAENHPVNKLGISLDVPNMGVQPGLLEQQQETRLGEMVLRQVAKEAPLYEDAWTQDELLKVFTKIYGNTALGTPIGLVMIKDDTINAFAVPGGLFALNTGLVLSADNLNEVAAVMGHEIAHVLQRHYSRSKDTFKNQNLLTLAGMLASILIASKGGGDAASAVAIGTQAAMIDQQLAYSRDQEREADRVGMYLMNAAGYDPRAMADFFEVMNRKTGRVSFLPDFWLTHPLSSERMSEARLRAAQFPRLNHQMVLADEANFRMMQYRVAVLTDQISEARLKDIADRDEAATLALATFYGRQGKYTEARTLAQKILSKHPDSSIAAITLAEIELKAGQPEQAIQILKPVQQVMPESRALALTLANAYTMVGKTKEALGLLTPLSVRNKRDTLVWDALESAANRLPAGTDKAPLILRYRAESQFWHGDVDQAIRSLLRASVLAQKNYALQAKIENRLKEMQDDRQFKG